MLGMLATVMQLLGWGMTINELSKRYKARGKKVVDPQLQVLRRMEGNLASLVEERRDSQDYDEDDNDDPEGISYDDLR